jgi:hypothetical protein
MDFGIAFTFGLQEIHVSLKGGGSNCDANIDRRIFAAPLPPAFQPRLALYFFEPDRPACDARATAASNGGCGPTEPHACPDNFLCYPDRPARLAPLDLVLGVRRALNHASDWVLIQSVAKERSANVSTGSRVPSGHWAANEPAGGTKEPGAGHQARGREGMAVSEEYKIYVDGGQPATLNDGAGA